MRSKEEAHDYRYFPEPDLPPLVVDDAWIDRVTNELPELPLKVRERFMSEYGLSDSEATILTSEREYADFVEEAIEESAPAKRVAHWFMTEMLAVPDARQKITPDGLAHLVKLIEAGTISGRTAKEVFAKMVATGDTPEAIVEREGLVQVSDAAAIEAAVREIVTANPKQVEQYRAGKTQVLGFFVGQVMKKMQGKANPALVNEILRRLLS